MQSGAKAYDNQIRAYTKNVCEIVESAELIKRHSLSCYTGSKTMYITALTTGSDLKSKIGFKNIKIQRSSDNSTWTTEKMFPTNLMIILTKKVFQIFL